jgi:hypothetical protein
MFLSYLTLFVALSLSVVAAFYSIAGLAAIFAAAVVPIVIMGSILEIAKLVVTVWLHEYWHQCKRTMKAYLVPAVMGLMLLTSMGIFGFLSKAHLDQAVPSGDIAAKVSLYDEKINTQKDNIKAARANLAQLDAAVNETMGRSTNEQGADKAVAIRRAQARDRAALTREIEQAQTAISKLQEERAPIAAEQRKVEAEVGPVKYIAALIYGDSPDTNLLEKAVRWVIILLVFVFDPLAVMMLLASTESLKWERGLKEPAAEETANPIKKAPPSIEDIRESVKNAVWDEDARAAEANALLAEVEREPETEVFEEPVAQEVVETVEPEDLDIPVLENEETWAQRVIDETGDLERPGDYKLDPDALEKQARRNWKNAHPDETIKHQERLFEQGLIDHLPWNEPSVSFGNTFPNNPKKGDSFIRVDMLPNRVYKWNGTHWIEVDRNSAFSYAYDDNYIDYLINKISSGEYDPDLLNDAERDQIEQRLRATNKNIGN